MIDLERIQLGLGAPQFALGQPVATSEGKGGVLGVKYRALNSVQYLVQVIEEEDEEIGEAFAFWYDESALEKV
ncbi:MULTISPECIES: hypothetical protein [Cyanophyceae]|uniref:hypothetical protein n=1 Tax=Cyanophyceae TaxID=3028117 RepID=UPI001688ADB1|nr:MULTISPECIES: hypothetical protein [Cyanophyceae]MBD1917278.1 hypothetical protein [Phormidium sp. FACHB-77]MBD2028494.1 hypothetical protein [Phormidium sp. FACHB-322]MBD2049675.1 hypothetical protein [Leptolyngbya sp. FACHB-60]